jgi:hypothetical protein
MFPAAPRAKECNTRAKLGQLEMTKAFGLESPGAVAAAAVIWLA